MFTKIRNRVEGDQGFTLIELLVVILIIGILAAIAIPSFLNQRTKGQDVCAKSMLRTMQTAMETEYTDQNSYVGGTLARLTQIENQIPNAPACGSTDVAQTPRVGVAGAAGCASAAANQNDYCVGMTSVSTRPFALHRSTTGAIIRVCGTSAGGGLAGTPTGNGGGCPSGTW